MQKIIDKAQQSKVTSKELFMFDEKIYIYNQANELDIDGTTLLYPTKGKVFENIKAGEVGKIQNLSLIEILDKLNCNRDAELSVIYVDGTLNSYIVDAGKPNSSDDPDAAIRISEDV